MDEDGEAYLERVVELKDQGRILLKSLQGLSQNAFMDVASASSLGKRVPPKLDGLSKLASLIKSEVAFLEKLIRNPHTIKPSHVQCTNISYLEAVVGLILQRPRVASVLKTFTYKTSEISQKVRVDIVADQGRTWIKTKSSSLKNLSSEFLPSDSEDDEISNPDIGTPYKFPIFAQANAWLQAASQNKVAYNAPTVIFLFYGHEEEAIDSRIVEGLRDLGIKVEFLGSPLDPSESVNVKNLIDSPPCTSLTCYKCLGFEEITETLNLDVTTLVAMATELTVNPENIPLEAMDLDALKAQFWDEKQRPLLSILQSIFHKEIASEVSVGKFCSSCQCGLVHRKLVTIKIAVEKLVHIAKLVGGWSEQARVVSLFEESAVNEIEVLRELRENVLIANKEFDGDFSVFNPFEQLILIEEREISPRFENLLEKILEKGQKGKLQEFHLLVFGTGDRQKVTTVTSNGWVLRSLKEEGISDISVLVHSPRFKLILI
ncbi:hypothetical protein HK096_006554 [Nowakowskiella sp. JEL0078]|nr:hypothetical protein HK096_006554 [Nowakowskiella sp. JEL0078]